MANRSHVLVAPLPGAGHINPMLQFSRRLVSKGLKVTFVITKFISKSRNLGSSIGSIQLDTISDGYDDGGFAQAGSMEAYLSRLHDVGPKNLSDLIKRHQTSSSPLHAVIYEPFLAWALEVAKDCGLFAAAFFTHACAVDYIFYSVYHEVLKLPVSSTPVLIEGLPLLLELQDLPSFVAVPDSYPANVKMTMSQFANLDKADRVLINTFYKLENEISRNGSPVLHTFTDADWGGNLDDCTSTPAYVTFLGKKLISWSSKKQRVVARSSTEAEYRALATATSETMWILHLLQEVGSPFSSPPKLLCDNLGATHLSYNPVNHSRMKHIQIDLHFVWDLVHKGVLHVHHVHTDDQLADLLTKPLSRQQTELLRLKIGLADGSSILKGRMKEITNDAATNDPQASRRSCST